ncbi:hypothetical protein BGZ46_010538 [Entomortierella lignicola]|nr:hypothetical protein BGZ46_010538 [Entomortierella lignicola]
MSNYPTNLNIFQSFGPPAGVLPVIRENEGTAYSLSIDQVTQDISTYGLAGKIWDSSYTIDAFLRLPSDKFTFTPPCPIPQEYFLSSDTSAITENVAPIKIVEIGAGTGYAGIALARRLRHNCTLVLTDLEEVVPLLEKNVQNNLPQNTTHINNNTDQNSPCSNVHVAPLAWGNSSHAESILSKGRVDYIVASDLVYFPELYPALLQTLREISNLDTTIIFGYKERTLEKESPFWEQFGRYFEMEAVRIEQKKSSSSEQQDDSEDDDNFSRIFGYEEGMYVFVAKKRQDKDILKGVDDTLATLMMMQVGY